jgi:peptide/nickel transport system substrate-binding protein
MMLRTRLVRRLAITMTLGVLALQATGSAQPLPATPTSAPTPPQVGRLKVAVQLEREQNDPVLMSLVYAAQFAPVYEALVEEDPWHNFVPMLATDWQMSPDGKTWTFNLRRGVQWHFGWGEFTARDVVHTLQRHVREGSVSVQVSLMRELLEHVEVVNDYQIIFRLPQPQTDLHIQLSTRLYNVILCKAYFAAEGQEGLNRKMVGTGPYQFKERLLGQHLLLERVPYQHWRVTPDFKELQFLLVPEPTTRLAMLLRGEAHLAIVPFETQPQATAKGLKVLKATVPTMPVYAMFGGNYLPSKPHYDPSIPWTKQQVREALNRAVDRQAIQKTLLGGRGDPMAVTFWDVTLPGWNPQWLEKYDAHYGYDPQRAQALLAAAGYPKGFKATYILTPRPELPELMQVGEVIADYWREIGVDVKLEEREFVWWREKFLKEQLHGLAWTDATLRFEDRDMVRIIYYSKGPVHFFESAFIDQKYEQYVATTDPQAQDQLLREIGNQLFDEYATLPLFWLYTEFVANPQVVADYKTSGIFPPRHLEYIKAVQ